MSYRSCSRCQGILLAEDRTCRLCRRPVHPPQSHAAPQAGPLTGRRARRGVRGDAHHAAHGHSHGAAALEVRGLTKVHGAGPLAVTAVCDVTFSVRSGEITLVMGPSGSGKTSLLLLLGAMARPTAGSVRIGDVEVTAVAERKLPALRARRLGFVFQDFNLLAALDARENVALAANLAGVRGAAAARRADAALSRVGLAHRAHARPAELSGGEKQRVAIARALVNDPPLLLADEPTANLDSTNGREVGELLRHLADDFGRTSLVVTHDDRLVPFADRVLWLEDGRLTERGHR